jgi:phosphoserine phosphatase
MKLILIRHGETIWNKERRVQGVSDIDLSEVGLCQARALSLSLKNHVIHAIYSSPLIRAHKTAQLINKYHNVPIYLESGMMEMDQGDFEGLSYQELMACEKDFLQRWIQDPTAVTMPNGESFSGLQNRAWPVIANIIDKTDNTIVVSHNFTIASILCKIKNISLSEFRSVCVDTASKTVVSYQQGAASIDVLNDRSHLMNKVG